MEKEHLFRLQTDGVSSWQYLSWVTQNVKGQIFALHGWAAPALLDEPCRIPEVSWLRRHPRYVTRERM